MKRASAIAENERRGALLVEMTVLMPVFLLLAWGTIEFGRAMQVGRLTTQAAQIGARAAILDGSTNSRVEKDVKQFLAQSLKGIDTSDVSVNISVTPISRAPNEKDQNSRNQLADSKPRDLCQITVVVPCHRVVCFSSRFLANTNLSGVCAMPHK